MVSNHRSILDAPLLITALGQDIHFLCHYYLTQVPLLNQCVAALGCIPLSQGSRPPLTSLRQAAHCLQQRRSVGIFPEGAATMVQHSDPRRVQPFHPGFLQVALGSKVFPVGIVPAAIIVQEEWQGLGIPLSLFRAFDPQEPLFQQSGSHPVVLYRQVLVRLGDPLWVGQTEQQLRGGARQQWIDTHTQQMQAQIQELLMQG
ncbi:MAG: lysophospholipid acyltransferase family protein [Synechococcales cyanobacterium]